MSAEAPRNSGTGEPTSLLVSERGFSGFLRRLFATPPEPQLTQQLKPHVPLNQLLDGIDHDRVSAKSAATNVWLQEQQAKEQALQEAWDKAKSLEASIKDFLTIADPVITEGLSILGRRTWGDYGFTIIKYGPSWNESGSYVTSSDFHNIINSEAANPPPLQYLYGAEFNYRAESLKYKAHPYDPYGGYYRATLEFRDGKPHSLQFGRLATALYEKELRMIGQEDVLTRSLVEYYRHGPEVHIFSGEG